MSRSEQYRTPASHKTHQAIGITHCGCMVERLPDEDLQRCPCGATYEKKIIYFLVPFRCYDCKRPL